MFSQSDVTLILRKASGPSDKPLLFSSCDYGNGRLGLVCVNISIAVQGTKGVVVPKAQTADSCFCLIGPSQRSALQQ